MDKLKGMLKISERDKKLLVVVLAVLIMALAYFFGFQNLSDQVDTLSTKKTTLETTQRDLKEKNNNKQKYVNDTMNYLKQYDNLLDRYAAGSTQPNSIDFFNKTESVTGTWVRSLSLSPTTVLYKFGQIASSNVNGKSNYTSNLTGYKSTINIAYESDYSQWKNFIKYVNTYADKSTIDALSASYMRQQVLLQEQHLFHFIQLKVESVIIRNHHLMLRQEQEIYSQQLHQLSNKRIQGEGYEII